MYSRFQKQLLKHLYLCKKVAGCKYGFDRRQNLLLLFPNSKQLRQKLGNFVALSYTFFLVVSFFRDFAIESQAGYLKLIFFFAYVIFRVVLYNTSFWFYPSSVHNELTHYMNTVMNFEEKEMLYLPTDGTIHNFPKCLLYL